MTSGRQNLRISLLSMGLLGMFPLVALAQEQATDPSGPLEPHLDYIGTIAPILNKYCTSCHNDDDREGDLSFDSFASLQEGGEDRPVLIPGQGTDSLLVRVISGESEPLMPPDGMDGPTEDELKSLIDWIDAGAPGPEGESIDRRRLLVPRLAPSDHARPITAMAWSANGERLAVARFQSVELTDTSTGQLIHQLQDLPGKVNSLRFANDGQWLVVGTGISGLYGEALVWSIESGDIEFRVQGHRDTLYAAVLSPDERTLATAGYDHSIVLWDLATGEAVRELVGHNQPVFDLAFSPDGQVLLSASGDETVKVWRVDTGERLDTLGQPLAEQYVTRFSPDGRFIVGAGADNRIRVWRFTSRQSPQINPLLVARFAHEGPVTHLEFSRDGSRLVSVSDDRSIKVWETATWMQVKILDAQPDIVSAVALSENGEQLYVGRMDGSMEALEIGRVVSGTRATVNQVVQAEWTDEVPMSELMEVEPNDRTDQATAINVPAKIAGTIHSTADGSGDADLFQFETGAGQPWIVEVKAKQINSPLDSYVEILNEQGEPVLRVLLQAVRDSYFTFRGKDSNTSDDFRVHNWEEMELNEYLYAGGEVVRLWLYPRGPDSGFQVYPGAGNRHAMFDTSPLAHALHAPCYIVEPHPPGTELIPTGLPVFPIYYENDDDAMRRLGSDSKLHFVAPADGKYFVRVTDARGFSGEDYRYELLVRRPKPDFGVTLGNANPTITAGGGREFVVTAERYDGFDGPITVEMEGLPDGFHCTSPITIEAGQRSAQGVVWADENAATPPEGHEDKIKVRAYAEIRGEQVTHGVNSLGKLQLDAQPKLRVYLAAIDDDTQREVTSADSLQPQTEGGEPAEGWSQKPFELVLAPGETIAARVMVERNGHKGPVSFGNADAGRNLPHGVYVDNIGLNGLLIVGGRSARTFFITAADFVPETTRTFHLRANVAGGQCSVPVTLHIRHPSKEVTTESGSEVNE